MNPIIEASNVSHHYARQSSVSDLSLNLQHGEVMALLGTNGAGKTTTLRLLTGDLAPDTGTININNVDLNLYPIQAKQYLGYLPDKAPLYDELSVDEYLYYCAKIHGLTTTEARKRVAKVKQFCELNAVGNRLIDKLSKGYQQRIGIAQAIIHAPKAIILDEPTNGLDPTQVQEMRDLILHLRNEAAVLLSTHQLNEVEQVCDRVLMLRQGHTILCEDIDKLQQANRIRCRFLCAVPLDTLNNHPMINKIYSISDNVIDLCTDEKLDTLKGSLIAQAQTQDWGLVEIFDVKDTLEDIFVANVLRGAH